MIQKIIRVGNSLAVTLPKNFIEEAKFSAGDEIRVEVNPGLRAVYMRSIDSDNGEGLTPEFKSWLDDICEKESDIIKALANS